MIPFPTYERSLITFLLTAAKTVIPQLWRSPAAPLLTDWFKEIFHLQRMEELRAESAKMPEKHLSILCHIQVTSLG